MILKCINIALSCMILIKIVCGENVDGKFSVSFEWNFINYTWKSPEHMLKATLSRNFIPGEDVIAGIKIYKRTIYLALPRVKQSARVTLASLSLDSPKENSLLEPYPSWEMNSGESCESLQNVLSMEIDREGVMWVLDAKRDTDTTSCPPRIILFDINRNGSVVKDFIVPNELCSYKKGCFLNDIVVDGDFAYMSDTTRSDPGVFVYNRKLNQAWKFRDETMRADLSAANFTAQGVTLTKLENINGVALSPNCGGNRTFYFMAQTGLNIYSMSTHILKNKSLANTNVSEFITNHGKKQAQSGGMICDHEGNIYYGLLPLDAVAKWNTNRTLQSSQIIEQNHEIIKWPDSFSFDDNGNLYLITNSILYFSLKGINVRNINFRIIKLHTGTRSYHYCSKFS